MSFRGAAVHKENIKTQVTLLQCRHCEQTVQLHQLFSHLHCTIEYSRNLFSEVPQICEQYIILKAIALVPRLISQPRSLFTMVPRCYRANQSRCIAK